MKRILLLTMCIVSALYAAAQIEDYTLPDGKVIKIDHSNGIFTLYCGIKTAYVKKGDIVGINQDIGNLGEIPCESVEKSHLHFAAIKDGVYISPLELVKFE